MKPKLQVNKVVIPAKVDQLLIEESKRLAKVAGFRFYNQYVEEALIKANKSVQRKVK